jgi:DNA polymerase-1
MNMHSLLLIDAMGIAYRSFFAIPALSTKNAVPTNAVFGFIKTLTNIIKKVVPEGAVVVFDGGIPPDRKALLETYKAQRPPMPEKLKMQFPFIERFLTLSGVPFKRMESLEADDVIATLATTLYQDFDEILILTSDKDLMQLVNEKVFIIQPSHPDIKIGRNEVFNKMGVYPEQVVDFLAITGDNADNISGLPGVGEKTAAKWLSEHGTLEKVIASTASLKPEKARLSLQNNLEILTRNKLMMQLNTSLNIITNKQDTKIGTADKQGLLKLYEELEFHSLAREMRKIELF